MEKFCLKWNDYESNISSAFKDLREENDFYDVTLACEDDSQMEAHKVILASSSPFFKNILKRNTGHHHPLLYLKGIKSKELSSILNFIYLGEISIADTELQEFLAAAEDLKIKGLTSTEDDRNARQKKSDQKLPEVSTCDDDDDIQEIPMIDQDYTGAVQDNEYQGNDHYNQLYQSQEEYCDYDEQYQEDQENNQSNSLNLTSEAIIEGVIIERFASAWKCGICKKLLSSKARTIDHIVDLHKISKQKVQVLVSKACLK